MPPKRERESNQTRINIIRAVQTPLGFFVLVVLIVEAMMGILAGISQSIDRTILIVGMLAIMLILIAIVAFLAYYRPEALVGVKPPLFDMEARLVFDEKLENIENAVVYYQKLPKPLSAKNKLTVYREGKNEPYVIVPKVRADDAIMIWLCHNDKWYASENVGGAAKRRLQFLPQTAAPQLQR